MKAFFPVPRAEAQPLAIMPVVRAANFFSLGTADRVAGDHDEDTKDMRAQHGDAWKMHAKFEGLLGHG